MINLNVVFVYFSVNNGRSAANDIINALSNSKWQSHKERQNRYSNNRDKAEIAKRHVGDGVTE